MELSKEQLRIFNAGLSKNDTRLAEFIARDISQIINQYTFSSKTDLCQHLTDTDVKTIRDKDVWQQHHLDSICKHVPWLEEQLNVKFGPKRHYTARRRFIDWIPRSWKQNDLCRRVEHLTWGKKTTHYRCVKSHTSSHMFSLDYSCWEKIYVR